MIKINKQIVGFFLFLSCLSIIMAVTGFKGCNGRVCQLGLENYKATSLDLSEPGLTAAIKANGQFVFFDSSNCSLYYDTLLYDWGLNDLKQLGNSSTLLVAGNNGKIYRTNWYKLGWTPINSNTTNNLNSISRCSSNFRIYVVGNNGTIIKSTDNGLSFNLLNSNTTKNLLDVQCIGTGDTVYVSAEDATFLRTTNSGLNWAIIPVYSPDPQFPHGFTNLTSVYFVNSKTGWVAGDYYIFKSTNAGLNWNVNFKIHTSIDNATLDMFFYNKDSGLVVGKQGDIQFTTNAGSNWFYNPVFQNLTTKNLNYFAFDPARGTAIVVGDSGIVISMDSITVGLRPISTIVPAGFMLYQNYPNPFNPVTKIRLDIAPASCCNKSTLLIIYDLLGQELVTLVNEPLVAGTYEVEWDASNFPSGVYFYTLSLDTYKETKKMVLIK